jgi:hypothetical protein
MKRKLNTTFTAALVLFGVLGSGRLIAQHQKISWGTMDDIRQVTKLATATHVGNNKGRKRSKTQQPVVDLWRLFKNQGDSSAICGECWFS